MKKTYKLKNGDEYAIRMAEIEDAEKLINYIKQVSSESEYLTFETDEMAMTVSDEEIFIKNITDSGNQCIIFAVLNDQIIGVLTVNAGNKNRIRHAGEMGITVLEKFWNNGIASNLIVEMIHWARENGMTKINLQVREDNQSAVHLYGKYGFGREGRLARAFYVNGKYYSSILMGMLL